MFFRFRTEFDDVFIAAEDEGKGPIGITKRLPKCAS